MVPPGSEASFACCLHPWRSAPLICSSWAVNASSPWLYFYTACINQTSTIISSVSLAKHDPPSLKYTDFMLNLAGWQEEVGNTAGSPSKCNQNQPSRKITESNTTVWKDERKGGGGNWPDTPVIPGITPNLLHKFPIVFLHVMLIQLLILSTQNTSQAGKMCLIR